MNTGTLSGTPRAAYTVHRYAKVLHLLALVPVFFLFFVGGCETPPPPSPEAENETGIIFVDKPLLPLTSTLIGYMGGNSLTGYQYYISNQVVLLKENSGVSARNVEGSLELTNVYTGEQITIEGSTPGVVVKVDFGAEENITALEACFEPGADNLTLRFIRTAEDSFDLEVLNGMVRYGGEFYRLMSAEKPVKLLVNLKAGDRSPYPKTRTVEGRLISDAASSAEVSIDDFFIPKVYEKEPDALYFPAEKTEPAGHPIPEHVETAQAFRPDEPAGNAPGFTGKPETQADTRPPVLTEPFIDPGVIVGELAYIALPSSVKTSAPGGQSYWIQVGAFKKDANAQRAYEHLAAAGFNPAYERRNGYCRIIIPDVAAEDIASVKRRLNSAGFPETLVRKAY